MKGLLSNESVKTTADKCARARLEARSAPQLTAILGHARGSCAPHPLQSVQLSCLFRFDYLASFNFKIHNTILISPQDFTVRLQNAFGRETPHLSTVRRWYAEFHRGHVSLHDEIREGRPSTAITEKNVVTVRKLTEENRRLPMRRFEDIWGLCLRKVKEKRPKILLHYDNASLHTAKKAISFLTSEKVKFVNLLAFSPDLELYVPKNQRFDERFDIYGARKGRDSFQPARAKHALRAMVLVFSKMV
ncbi:hypothetical protein EVAR_7990_1 [Eumeta japonica]|uniref:Mos1 transposase HTH domain-containing protein n=1 Tax=Eumeta variegata TaxID=151549 RepID=A0A4C1TGX2_EUMVA|nr:hypothetical protein EVAR_7990_1 [Eumeta japonica]